jgi:hypothetical protein
VFRKNASEFFQIIIKIFDQVLDSTQSAHWQQRFPGRSPWGYGSGAVTSGQMLKAGSILDVVSILIVYAVALLLGPIILAN